jgi:hypothetical protein
LGFMRRPKFEMWQWLFFICCALVGIALGLTMFGCESGGKVPSVPDSLPAVGTSVEKTGAHVESAERLTVAAKPQSNPVGKALLDQVSKEHELALESVDDSKGQLLSANAERTKLEGIVVEQGRTITRIESGWGYKLQVWVTATLRTIEIILGSALFIHFACGTAAMFTPLGAATKLGKVAALVNPLGWFQAIVSHKVATRKAIGSLLSNEAAQDS